MGGDFANGWFLDLVDFSRIFWFYIEDMRVNYIHGDAVLFLKKNN